MSKPIIEFEDSFTYRDEFYYLQDGKYFKMKYGLSKRVSIKKKDFYKCKEKADGSNKRD